MVQIENFYLFVVDPSLGKSFPLNKMLISYRPSGMVGYGTLALDLLAKKSRVQHSPEPLPIHILAQPLMYSQLSVIVDSSHNVVINRLEFMTDVPNLYGYIGVNCFYLDYSLCIYPK